MATLSSYESRFHQLLAKRVDEEADTVARHLARGKARLGGAEVTAQAYAEWVGYVRGLEKVLEFGKEIEDDLNGREKKK